VVKDYYTGAMLELLKRKPFSDITVSDLVRKSGASRASFYRNYESKEQIVDEYLEEIFGRIIEKYPISAANIREQVPRIFSEIYEWREDLEVLKNAGLLDQMDHLILRDTIGEIQKNQVLHNKYQPYFFAGAASALIKAWVEFGFTETPEEITDIFFRSLSGYMAFD
jgi:AcrR family transcriptional regulator